MVIPVATGWCTSRVDQSSRSSLRAVPGEKGSSLLSGQAHLQGVETAIAEHAIGSGGRLRVLSHLANGLPMTRHATCCTFEAKTRFVLSRRVLPQPAGPSSGISASDLTQVRQEEASGELAEFVACLDRESVDDCPPRGRALNAERALEDAWLAHVGTLGLLRAIRTRGGAEGQVLKSWSLSISRSGCCLPQTFFTPPASQQNGIIEPFFGSSNQELVEDNPYGPFVVKTRARQVRAQCQGRTSWGAT